MKIRSHAEIPCTQVLSCSVQPVYKISPKKKTGPREAETDGRLRSVIHSSAPPILPNRSAGLCRRVIYEGVAYCAMPQFLTLGANGKAMKYAFSVIRLCYEKIGHMLKPLMPKFRSDRSARLKVISEEHVPAKVKPIVGYDNGL